MKSKSLIGILLVSCLLITGRVFAGMPESPPSEVPETSTNITNQNAALAGAAAGVKFDADIKTSSGAVSGSHSGSRSTSGASANNGGVKVASAGGEAHATGGDGGNAASESAANAGSNIDISSDDDTSLNYPRQTPAVILPMLLRGGCGAGFGAGGSDPKGAGAVSALFTSDQCYAFQSISLAVAMGDYEGACHLMADVNRDAYKRRKYSPDCVAFGKRLTREAELAGQLAQLQAKASSVVNVDTSKFVTQEQREQDKADASEALKKAFRKSVSK